MKVEPDPCRPSSPAACCSACARRDDSIPALATLRPRVVLLDASLVAWPRGLCPTFLPALPVSPEDNANAYR